MRKLTLLVVSGLVAATLLTPRAGAAATPTPELVPISDLTTIAGVRDNLLVGYGLVVGLNGTGDRQTTIFTTQTLANILLRMGVQIPATQIMVYNVAAVFVTATLPPFARPGTRIDVTVSSTGDARSLSGGLLLLSSLHGPDGNVYAEAQGPLTVGGFSASGGGGNSVTVNQTNVGIIPAGGIVERDTSVDLTKFKQLSLLLREPDFVTADAVAAAINQALGSAQAKAMDSRQIDVQWPTTGDVSIPDFIAKLETVPVAVSAPARVVVDERTGTIVIGNNVHLSPVSILHGDLAIQVSTVNVPIPQIMTRGALEGGSSPLAGAAGPEGGRGGEGGLGGGGGEVGAGRGAAGAAAGNSVPETTLKATEHAAAHITLQPGATVQDLLNALQAIGATPRDIIGILRAIKAAGALQADLTVI